jgi:hypothetical protein
MVKHCPLSVFAFATIFLTATASCRPDQPPANIDGYSMTPSQANIAPTVASMPISNIVGDGQRPRVSTGHPCTLWDGEDVEHYQALLKTNKSVQGSLATLTAALDQRITQPLGVPVPSKGADGAWVFPGDLPPASGNAQSLYRTNEGNAETMTDLGTAYALTGDPKYGEYCRKMLLAYAFGFPRWGYPPNYTPKSHRSERDGRLTGQFLEDGGWLIRVARAYDLVYNLPSWTDSDRIEMRNDLFEPACAPFTDDVLGPVDYLDHTHNRAVICNCGVLMAGYACDDSKLVDTALYGKNGSKQHPTGGVFGVDFTTQCIDVDGMWNEGAMGYQFMALCAMVNDAETLWHHGIDLYRYDGSLFKRLFDSPIEFAYPDMTTPATHDSGRVPLVDSPDQWRVDDCHHAYEYAYRHYRDPRYLALLAKNRPSLHMSIHQGPPSVLFDTAAPQTALPIQNVNFYGVGYGILRLPGQGASTNSLLLEYGPSRSHSHPDKLAIDLYAFDDVLLPDPGSVFPYSLPLEDGWYQTTLGHCALTVDGKNQIYEANKWKLPRNTPAPEAEQLVYGPAATIGMQRAWSDTVSTGVVEDRAVFFAPQYLADIFGAFSASQHTYDLAYHIRGTVTSVPPLSPMSLPASASDGYQSLTDLQHFPSDQPWTVTTARNGHLCHLVAAGCAGTDVIVANGYYKSDKADEKTPTIIERRMAPSTVYGNAVDISGDAAGYVSSVRIAGGSLADGYALLSVETKQGTDSCFASYRPGSYKTPALETDGIQAMVRRDGAKVVALYLAGGTRLKAASAQIERSTPGLASVEKLPNGHYLIANPSGDEATMTVALPELAGATLVGPSGKATVQRRQSPAAITLTLPAGAKAELAPKP